MCMCVFVCICIFVCVFIDNYSENFHMFAVFLFQIFSEKYFLLTFYKVITFKSKKSLFFNIQFSIVSNLVYSIFRIANI